MPEPRPTLVFNWDEIIKIVVNFAVAVACASIPLLIVKVAYPKFLLLEDGLPKTYYDVSDYVMIDFSYIGIGVFITYFFFWITAPLHTGKSRKHTVLFFRGFSLVAVIVCFTNYHGWHSENVIIPKTIEYMTGKKAPSSALEFEVLDKDQIFSKWRSLENSKFDRKFGIFWSVIATLGFVFSASLSQVPLLLRRSQ